MGLTWITEIISWAVGGADYYWYIPDFANMLRAVFIFVIFCCKKKVLMLLRSHLASYLPQSKIKEWKCGASLSGPMTSLQLTASIKSTGKPSQDTWQTCGSNLWILSLLELDVHCMMHITAVERPCTVLWYVHESCWKKKSRTSSSPCDRHLILLRENPAQTHQIAGIYAAEWDHYQHCLPLHIPLLLLENKEEKAWSSTKSKQIHLVKNEFCFTLSDFSFWVTLFIFTTITCSLKMSKYFVHWQAGKPYEDLMIVLGYSFWYLLITFTHIFTGVKTGNMPVG